jgi:hypothetical protein
MDAAGHPPDHDEKPPKASPSRHAAVVKTFQLVTLGYTGLTERGTCSAELTTQARPNEDLFGGTQRRFRSGQKCGFTIAGA